jgi:hypothetical protein
MITDFHTTDGFKNGCGSTSEFTTQKPVAVKGGRSGVSLPGADNHKE